MKALFICLICICGCLEAQSQMSRYFEYDRDRVRSVEEISASTVSMTGMAVNTINVSDTTGSRKKYFWYGVLGGETGCLAGVGFAYLLGEVLALGTPVAWVCLVSGAVLGTVIPLVIIGRQTGDRKNSGTAALGSLTAIGVSSALLVALLAFGGG